MDRRQKKTEDLIIQSFIQLLMKKSFNQITVKEIIDTANIGRSTFYNHYETKDQLLQSLCIHLFDHVFQQHDHKLNFKDIITHILYHLKDDHNVLARLLVSESSELFVYYFKQYIENYTESSLFKDLVLSYPDIPREFIQNHITISFVGMVQWWIKNDMKETPETMSEYFITVMSHPMLKK